jgi:hypothetical protein
MLMLSDSHTQNIYAIPSAKYVIQTEPSSDVEIVTYHGGRLFKRYPFRIDLGNYLGYDDDSKYHESSFFYLDRDDNTKEYYIVPLELILRTQSVKDLLNDKETYSNDVESYSLLMNAIKNEFNKLEKLPAEWIEHQNGDIIFDEMGLKNLLEYQLELSELSLPSELELSKKEKELYIYQTRKRLSPFLQFSY